MSISYVQSTSAAVSQSSGSKALAFTSNNTAGNLIVVCAGLWRAGGFSTASLSDSQGNTYTQAALRGAGSSGSAIWYAPNCKAGANTVTVTSPATVDIDLVIAEYSGADVTAPLDAAAIWASNDGGSGPTLSINSSDAMLSLFAYYSSSGSATQTPSPSTNLNLRQHTSNPDGDESSYWDSLVLSTGSYTNNVGNAILVGMATFKGGAAAESQQPCLFILM